MKICKFFIVGLLSLLAGNIDAAEDEVAHKIRAALSGSRTEFVLVREDHPRNSLGKDGIKNRFHAFNRHIGWKNGRKVDKSENFTWKHRNQGIPETSNLLVDKGRTGFCIDLQRNLLDLDSSAPLTSTKIL